MAKAKEAVQEDLLDEDEEEFGDATFEEGKLIVVEVELWGKRPLVMDPKTEEIQDNIRSGGVRGTKQDIVRLTGGSVETEAELKLIKREGILGIPFDYVQMAMINAGKSQIYKKHLKLATNDGSWVSSLIQIREEFMPLVGNKKWTAWKKAVPLKRAGGGSQVNVRPLFPAWGFKMTLEFDPKDAPEALVKDVVKRCGTFYGIGAARKLGYGRFKIVGWKVIEEDGEAS